MNKKSYNAIDLTCVLQQSEEVTTDNCPTGIISRTDDGHFRFEESIRKGRAPRNPKLFDGKFISMVRMQNGRYQMHLKTMDSRTFDRENFAFGVYSEITTALQIID